MPELKGWALQLAAHQTADRELLHRLVTGTTAYRQIVFASLAPVAAAYRTLTLGMTVDERDCPDRARALNERVRLLRTARGRDVLAEVYGTCPPGYLGVLSRTGDRAQPPAYYRLLHDVLSDPNRRSEARALAHLPQIDMPVLAAARILPAPLRRPEVLSIIRDGCAAEQVEQAVRLLRSVHPGIADDRQLRHAASHSPDVRRLVLTALKRVDAPLPRGPALGGFVQLANTAALRSHAREFQNCLGEAFMVAACIGGQRLVYKAQDTSVLAEVGRSEEGDFVLLAINGVGNRPLPRHVQTTMRQRLARHGIDHRHAHLLRTDWDVFEEIEDAVRREERVGWDDLDFLAGLEEKRPEVVD